MPSFSTTIAVSTDNKKATVCSQTLTITVVASAVFADVTSNQNDLAREISTIISNEALSGRKTCFFGMTEELARACPPNYLHAYIGAEPRWNLALWQERQKRNKSIRNSCNAALRLGCEVREVLVFEELVSQQCEHIRRQWLQTKRLPPLHFVAETALHLSGKRLFVVELRGTIVGYALVSEAGSGVQPMQQVEHFVRLSSAPHGTTELLICRIGEQLALEGAHTPSLMLAPFSQKVQCTLPEKCCSASMKRYLQVIERFGGYWYNVKGLEYFKAKFQPDDWIPLYCSFPEDMLPVKILCAFAEVFLGTSLAKGFLNIARQTILNIPIASRRKNR